jgi:hypothetical protein
MDEYHALVGVNRYKRKSVFTEYDRTRLDKAVPDYFGEMLQVLNDR